MKRNLEEEQRILCDFLATYAIMTEVPSILGYAAPYARSLVLNYGVAEEDYILIGGRYFVSRTFLKQLCAIKQRK